MKITLFGFLWTFLFGVSFFVKNREKYIISWLILSYIFQAAIILSWGDKSLDVPTYSALIYIVNFLITKGKIKKHIPRYVVLLGVFLCIVTVVSVLASIFFKGVEFAYAAATVNEMYMKYDGDIPWYGLVFLCIQLLSIIALCNSIEIKWKDIDRILTISIIIVAICGVIQYLSLLRFIPSDNIFVKLIYSDSQYIHYNSLIKNGYKYTNIFHLRMHSTFVEPSCFAGYITALFFIYLNRLYDYKNKLKCIILIVMGVLSFSATAYMGIFCAIIFTLYITNGYKKRIKKLIQIFCAFIILCLIVYCFNLYDVIYDRIITKSESESAYVRAAWNMSSFDIFLKTYGLGLGYKYRGSGMIYTLIGAYGWLGTIIYIFFVLECVIEFIRCECVICLKREIYIALLLVIILQFVSLGLLTYSVFWMMLSISVIVRKGEFEEYERNCNYSTTLL